MTHVTFQPEDACWAVLSLPTGVKLRNAERRRALELLLEPLIPWPLEDVHAAFVQLDEGRYVACVLPQERVRQVWSDGASSLCPRSVPAEVGSVGRVELAPSSINLLTGAFEPIAGARSRALMIRVIGLTTGLLLLLLSIGLHRRAIALSALHRDQAMLLEQLADRYAPTSGAVHVPPDLRLEVAAREAARREGVRGTRVLIDDLASIVSAFPEARDLAIERLEWRGGAIILSATGASTVDAEMLVNGLGKQSRWTDLRPSISADGLAVKVALTMSNATIERSPRSENQ